AEDGIRDFHVTGVQTCALPISTEDDFYAEYLSLDIAAAVVDSLDDAIAHIRKYGSRHTDAIVTRSLEAARRFAALVDSAAIAVRSEGRRVGKGVRSKLQ